MNGKSRDGTKAVPFFYPEDERIIVPLSVTVVLRRWFIFYILHDFTNGTMENPAKDFYCVGTNAFIPF